MKLDEKVADYIKKELCFLEKYGLSDVSTINLIVEQAMIKLANPDFVKKLAYEAQSLEYLENLLVLYVLLNENNCIEKTAEWKQELINLARMGKLGLKEIKEYIANGSIPSPKLYIDQVKRDIRNIIEQRRGIILDGNAPLEILSVYNKLHPYVGYNYLMNGTIANGDDFIKSFINKILSIPKARTHNIYRALLESNVPLSSRAFKEILEVNSPEVIADIKMGLNSIVNKGLEDFKLKFPTSTTQDMRNKKIEFVNKTILEKMKIPNRMMVVIPNNYHRILRERVEGAENSLHRIVGKDRNASKINTQALLHEGLETKFVTDKYPPMTKQERKTVGNINKQLMGYTENHAVPSVISEEAMFNNYVNKNNENTRYNPHKILRSISYAPNVDANNLFNAPLGRNLGFSSSNIPLPKEVVMSSVYKSLENDIKNQNRIYMEDLFDAMDAEKPNFIKMPNWSHERFVSNADEYDNLVLKAINDALKKNK